MDPRLLDVLVCPVCKGPLKRQMPPADTAGADAPGQPPVDFELVCRAEGLAYPVRDGIPVMLVDEARRLTAAP